MRSVFPWCAHTFLDHRPLVVGAMKTLESRTFVFLMYAILPLTSSPVTETHTFTAPSEPVALSSSCLRFFRLCDSIEIRPMHPLSPTYVFLTPTFCSASSSTLSELLSGNANSFFLFCPLQPYPSKLIFLSLTRSCLVHCSDSLTRLFPLKEQKGPKSSFPPPFSYYCSRPVKLSSSRNSLYCTLGFAMAGEGL